MKLLIRLLISPVVFVCILISLIAASIGICVVWVLDTTYDHDAAMAATNNILSWLDGLLHNH